MRATSTKKSAGSGGFTLVELLIVVAIIAILAAIAIPFFTKYKLRAFKTEVDSDAKNIYIAAQAYLTDNPASTITSINQLNTGGFQKSKNIVFDNGSLSPNSGNIEIHSTMLKSQAKDNNAVIVWDGTISYANSP